MGNVLKQHSFEIMVALCLLFLCLFVVGCSPPPSPSRMVSEDLEAYVVLKPKTDFDAFIVESLSNIKKSRQAELGKVCEKFLDKGKLSVVQRFCIRNVSLYANEFAHPLFEKAIDANTRLYDDCSLFIEESGCWESSEHTAILEREKKKKTAAQGFSVVTGILSLAINITEFALEVPLSILGSKEQNARRRKRQSDKRQEEREEEEVAKKADMSQFPFVKTFIDINTCQIRSMAAKRLAALYERVGDDDAFAEWQQKVWE